ncbi:MAG: hypothetical protein JW866_08670 [Ignavibacteriales bacterium]|nr:hypothetical protein [Ignavibacteriales bacterium]
MPKFKILKDGVNKALMSKTQKKVEEFLHKMFKKDEVIKVDNIYSFNYYKINVSIYVEPWHSKDVLVKVVATLPTPKKFKAKPELMKEMLGNNAMQPFGAFGLSFNDKIVYSYALAGANLDYNELLAAVQTVAIDASDFAEKLK